MGHIAQDVIPNDLGSINDQCTVLVSSAVGIGGLRVHVSPLQVRLCGADSTTSSSMSFQGNSSFPGVDGFTALSIASWRTFRNSASNRFVNSGMDILPSPRGLGDCAL